jgi:hypothetical protein
VPSVLLEGRMTKKLLGVWLYTKVLVFLVDFCYGVLKISAKKAVSLADFRELYVNT